MKRHIGENLVKNVEKKKHDDFVSFVKSGGRLSYKQIKELNSVYKDDYMKMMLQNSEDTNKYLNRVND